MVSLSNRLWYFTLLSFELYGYFLGLESRFIERCKEWLILLGRLIQIIVGDPTRSFIIILLISPDLPLSLATFLPLNGINLQIQVFKINTFGQYLILSLRKVLFLIIEIVVHYGLIHIISTMVTSAFFEVGFKIIITRGITSISSLSNTRIICNLSHIFINF